MNELSKKDNTVNFILYISSIILITSFFIVHLTLKNECNKNEREILKTNKSISYNSNIVKELQSRKNYLLSESSIINSLSNRLVAAAPETLLIYIDVKQ